MQLFPKKLKYDKYQKELLFTHSLELIKNVRSGMSSLKKKRGIT